MIFDSRPLRVTRPEHNYYFNAFDKLSVDNFFIAYPIVRDNFNYVMKTKFVNLFIKIQSPSTTFFFSIINRIKLILNFQSFVTAYFIFLLRKRNDALFIKRTNEIPSLVFNGRNLRNSFYHDLTEYN